MAEPQVAIILGSDSDWEVMERCYQQLQSFDVSVEAKIRSAHRSPDALRDYVRAAESRGVQVFIAGAGMAAALPGAVAAYTTRPVIGVPLASGALQGIDSLLSMVQMPPGVPVGTVAIGPAGARNAALLAVQILALSDPRLAEALENFKRKQAENVDSTSQSLRERLKHG
jgi:5-(carboxyamino)imidazole ribonucleotide mutase